MSYNDLINATLYFLAINFVFPFSPKTCSSSDEVMLRPRVFGPLALGWSSLQHSKGLLWPKPGCLKLAKTGFEFGPRSSILSVNSHRFCSVLGSPACGSNSGPGQDFFSDILDAFPKNRSYTWIYSNTGNFPIDPIGVWSSPMGLACSNSRGSRPRTIWLILSFVWRYVDLPMKAFSVKPNWPLA